MDEGFSATLLVELVSRISPRWIGKRIGYFVKLEARRSFVLMYIHGFLYKLIIELREQCTFQRHETIILTFQLTIQLKISIDLFEISKLRAKEVPSRSNRNNSRDWKENWISEFQYYLKVSKLSLQFQLVPFFFENSFIIIEYLLYYFIPLNIYIRQQ